MSRHRAAWFERWISPGWVWLKPLRPAGWVAIASCLIAPVACTQIARLFFPDAVVASALVSILVSLIALFVLAFWKGAPPATDD